MLENEQQWKQTKYREILISKEDEKASFGMIHIIELHVCKLNPKQCYRCFCIYECSKSIKA